MIFLEIFAVIIILSATGLYLEHRRIKKRFEQHNKNFNQWMLQYKYHGHSLTEEEFKFIQDNPDLFI